MLFEIFSTLRVPSSGTLRSKKFQTTLRQTLHLSHKNETKIVKFTHSVGDMMMLKVLCLTSVCKHYTTTIDSARIQADLSRAKVNFVVVWQ